MNEVHANGLNAPPVQLVYCRNLEMATHFEELRTAGNSGDSTHPVPFFVSFALTVFTDR
jgi:hypothetical protein